MNAENGVKKLSLFRRLKIAIIDLEHYILFIPEKLRVAVLYALKMSIILAIIITLSESINIFARYGSLGNYVDTILPNFKYSDKKIVVEDEKNKDKIDTESLEYSINTMARSSGIEIGDFSKADLVKEINKLSISTQVILAITYTIMNMLDLFLYWLLTAVLIVIQALILLAFSKIRMRFKIAYSLSIYASTLSLILTVVYSILNKCFGIYIDIFDYIFIIIAYIYISAVILMIKSELIKQQMELIRIVNVQKEVNKEMEEKQKEEEQEGKDKEDKKEEKKKENKDGKEKNKEEEKDIPNEPDGSEI